MLKIINPKLTENICNRNIYESTILKINGINSKNIYEILPDNAKKSYRFSEYFTQMSRLKEEDSFYNYLKDLDKNKKICIIGDYDCDGILGTTIMAAGLSVWGFNVIYMIPDRFLDGYGMKKKHIDSAILSDSDLIITVDNGITCIEEIQYAKDKGIPVIVTDHHTPNGENPADIVIDPLYNNDKYQMISGACVAFKLIYNIFEKEKIRDSVLFDLAALAGITTLSDVMPLIGENRILYHATMNYCNSNKRNTNTFIYKLGELLSFYVMGSYMPGETKPLKNFNKTTVDFYLSPVINAINRVNGDVTVLVGDLLEILWGDSTCELDYYAKINKTRKEMKKELLELHKPDPNHSVIVESLNAGRLDNYKGVGGLVASEVVENEKKPALIGVDRGGEYLEFSGRSVSGYSLFEALNRVKENNSDLDLNFGGHAEALGGRIRKDQITKLADLLSFDFDTNFSSKDEELIHLTSTNGWICAYRALFPFGNKFKLPQFYCKSKVLYCNASERWVKMKFIGDSPIKIFNKRDLDYVMEFSTKHRDREIELILDMCYDDSGEIMFKLVNVLNRDPKIEEDLKRKNIFNN